MSDYNDILDKIKDTVSGVSDRGEILEIYEDELNEILDRLEEIDNETEPVPEPEPPYNHYVGSPSEVTVEFERFGLYGQNRVKLERGFDEFNHALTDLEREKVLWELEQLGGRRWIDPDGDNLFIIKRGDSLDFADVYEIGGETELTGQLYFSDRETLEKAIEDIGEQRILKYLFYDGLEQDKHYNSDNNGRDNPFREYDKVVFWDGDDSPMKMYNGRVGSVGESDEDIVDVNFRNSSNQLDYSEETIWVSYQCLRPLKDSIKVGDHVLIENKWRQVLKVNNAYNLTVVSLDKIYNPNITTMASWDKVERVLPNDLQEGNTVVLIETDETEHYSELYDEVFSVVDSYGGNTILKTSDNMYLDIETGYLFKGSKWKY